LTDAGKHIFLTYGHVITFEFVVRLKIKAERFN